MPPDKVGVEIRIGKLQKRAETLFIVRGEGLVRLLDEPDQEGVELPHAPPTTPTEPGRVGVQARASLVAPMCDQFLDFRNRPGGVEILRTRLGAVEDRVATVEPERIFQ